MSESRAVNEVIGTALASMREAGATLVDLGIPNLMDHIIETSLYGHHSRHDINAFLATRPTMPTKTLEEIRDRKAYHPALDLLVAIFGGPDNPEDEPDYHRKLASRDRFKRLVVGLMARNRLDGIVFPSVQVLPPSREEVLAGKHRVLTFPTNTLIAAQTWMPSICVPAGFSEGGLPVGLEIVVLPYHEPDLFRLGAAFEAATKQRRAPTYMEEPAAAPVLAE